MKYTGVKGWEEIEMLESFHADYQENGRKIRRDFNKLYKFRYIQLSLQVQNSGEIATQPL